MDEMCQGLGMTGALKTQADPSGLSRLFRIAGAQGIGAGRHKKSLNLGLRSMTSVIYSRMLFWLDYAFFWTEGQSHFSLLFRVNTSSDSH
jgi:hypothetical protein